MLLQIMEDGSLADAKGRRVDFRNTIIIMTSNIGAEEISRDMTFGFVSRDDEETEKTREHTLMHDKVMQRLKQTFRPEFINRIDATIVFQSLTKEEIRKIVDLEMERVLSQLKEHEIELEITVEAKDLIGKEGYDHTYGARPLRRVIQNKVEDPLAEGMLQQKFLQGSTVKIDAKDEEITLTSVAENAGSESEQEHLVSV
jgi:ATP-dependent Clp protease ATP-binding subunit ClpC